jgi:hypothetical protein
VETQVHNSIKRLAEVVGPPADARDDQDNWYSVYLGNEKQIPRVYTTRAHTHDLAWWHQQNGIVTGDDFGKRPFSGRYMEQNDAAEAGFEIVSEMTVPFVNERTGFKAAVMLETYDPDAFLGAWGVAESRAVTNRAIKVAEFLGFFHDESDCELILPEGALAFDDLEACGIAIVTDVNDNLLRRIKADSKQLHTLTPREFEKLISRLLLDLGFHIWLTPHQKDGGRDVLAISKSPAGTVLTLVECKKYREDRPVPVDVVRGVYGVMQQQRATNALIATTSRFTKDAIEFRDTLRYQITLKDAGDIAEWIAKYS